MARNSRVERRLLIGIAIVAALPIVVFGMLVLSDIQNKTSAQARESLRGDSKTYALIVLERLQVFAGVEPAQHVIGDAPELEFAPHRAVFRLPTGQELGPERYLWDVDQTADWRCVMISGREVACGGGTDPGVETISETWSFPLNSIFASADSVSVTTSRSREVALNALTLFQRLLPLIALLTSLVVVGAVYYVLAGRLRPLRALERATRKLGDGDYSARVDLNTGDEFETLGDAFNRMTERLGRSFVRARALANIDRMIVSGAPLDEIVREILALDEGAGPGRRELVLLPTKARSAPTQYRLIDGRLSRSELPTLDDSPTAAAPEAQLLRAATAASTLSGAVAHTPILAGEQLAGLLLLHAQGDADDLADRLSLAVAYTRQNENLYRQAHYDLLTGLINRHAFEDRLKEAMAQSVRCGAGGALLFLDLDRFKYVNDTEGHKAGDRLLVLIARRLRGCVRDNDLIARFGGDEFGVLLADVSRPAEVVEVCNRILVAAQQPLVVDRIQHVVGASIGVALFPQDAEDAETLLMHADVAMYRTKALGGGSVTFFDSDLNAEARDRVLIESRLRAALSNKALRMVFQPKLNVLTGGLDGAEALMRWQDEELGFVPPDRFIPVAEATGLIHDFLAVCIEQTAWLWNEGRRRGSSVGRVAINASPRQLLVPGFATRLLAQLAEHGLPATALEVEFTESVFSENVEQVIVELSALRSAGVTVSLDDFGTGYSSLNMLRRLPLDVVKIDRSFIVDIDTSDEALALVQQVIVILHALGKQVVAEGIETREHLDLLAAADCDLIQGYFVSRPLEAEQFWPFCEAYGTPIPDVAAR